MLISHRMRFARAVVLAAVLLGGWLLGGCGTGEPEALPVDRLSPGQTTPQLLPTPTLAAPGGFDLSRPPTPVITPPATTPDDTSAAPTPPEAADIDLAAPPTATTPPTVVPLPEGATPLELLELGHRSAAEGDHITAAAAFRAVVDEPGDLDAAQVDEARLGLAIALLVEGQPDGAALELEALVQAPRTREGRKGGELLSSVNIADIAAFQLGQARRAMGDHAGAIEAYRAYLQNNPDMAAYVQPLIADAHETLGNTDGVMAAMESAVDAPAQRFRAVANRMRLASLYLARDNYAGAIAQYDAIHDIARTEATKGQVTYLAGRAEIAAGNTAAGYERHQKAINDYPRAAESYQALVALLDAGVPVDEYQRGIVDYYAGAYQPAVEALRRYIAAAPDDFITDGSVRDAHAFLAWSLEGLGTLDAALAELDTLEAIDPQRALFERGEMLRRAGRAADALAAYDELLAGFPDMDGAAGVLWTAAVLADDLNEDDAQERYLRLADAYPFDANAPRALARAAELAADGGDAATQLALRQRLVEQYPANIHGAEALFRLLKTTEGGSVEGLDADALAAQVESLSPSNYFALRAADLVAGNAPFTAVGPMAIPDDPEAGRAEAEAWLRERLAADGTTPPAGELGALSAELAADPHRIVGEKLWQLGLLEEGKAELELVRETYGSDPLANYQMARYFGQLGLYRSSIIATAALLQQTGATVFDAPLYLGRLSYPTYYADLILPLAERYGFDPRLQFALVRQESLFESIARSGAAAQGLSQVIPDTGVWIAQRLAWPDYDNADLYKPYVGLNFGAYYLSEQLRNFDGHVHAALAAYNGGPGNAARWYGVAGGDLDAFVDTVNFPETRLYIERIYEGFNAYRHLYSGP